MPLNADTTAELKAPLAAGLFTSAVLARVGVKVGNKVLQRDALGRETKWEYDALGRMTKRTLPLVAGESPRSESFSYDAVGNVKTHTTFAGEVIAYDYDALNRLKTKTLPGNNAVTYTYTATGQVETLADTRGTTRFAYDARDRLTKVEHPEGWTLEYGYDAAGNRASLSTRYQQEPAKVATYEYDRANRLTKVTSPEGEVTSFTYDAAGNRATAIQPNGITTTWTYDARGRVTAIAHKKTAGGAIVAQYDYTFNAQGLRATQTFRQPEGAGSSTCRSDYSYDALGRLTGSQVRNVATCPFFELSHTYTYDAVGNRLTESEPTAGTPRTSSFTYDAADRLIAVTGNKQATYEYDANGNVVKQTLPKPPNTPSEYPPQVTQYRWDAEGRLIGMTAPDQRTFTYLYDAEGQLVREIQGTDPNTAAVTYYLADKNLAFSQILEERDGAGILKVGYQYAETKPIKQVRGASSSYYLGDHLSTRILTDASGTAQNVYTYRPYGEVERQTGSGAGNTPAVGNSVLFAGERFDSNLSLYYNRARYLDPKLGRFAGIDSNDGSAEAPRTLNDYVYGNDDPFNTIDPSGEFGLSDVNSALGALGNAFRAAIPNFLRSSGRNSVKGPKLDVFRISKGLRGKATGLGLAPHFGVYVEYKGMAAGYRYDIGASDEDFRRVVSAAMKGNINLSVPGGLSKSFTPRLGLTSQGWRIFPREAEFTFMQWAAWEVIAVKPFFGGFTYCLSGINCASWSVMAMTEAKAVQKLKLYP